MIKKKIFMALTLMITCFCSNPVLASASETIVKGYISPTIIDVSAPATVVFSIDPNAEESSQFISPEIVIENHSNAPVKVSIESGASNFIQAESSSWKPSDVLPDEYDWEKLGTKESESYLALGIKAMVGSWRKLTTTEAIYVKEQEVNNKSIVFGELEGHSSVKMALTGNYGLSFSESKQCIYKIIWTFGLAD